MGGSRISYDDMSSYYRDNSHITRSTNASQVFKETYMRDEFNPAKIKLPREACDSSFTPNSRAIIFAEDVTGSMDSFLHSLIKDDFPRLIKQIYEITSYDPHIMFMGVGDVAAGDRAPLQVTQFEADLRMLEQLQKIYIEHGGGGNDYESYILPWYFAGKHVKMDCWEKRKEKGFLFTFGDEMPTPKITSRQIKEVFEDNDELDNPFLTADDCLEMASEKFNCYHIILHGSFYARYPSHVANAWRDLMGSHVCDLSDHECLPELVSTILKMHEGISKTDAINLIQNNHSKSVVSDALKWHEENVEVSDKSSTETDMEVF